MKKNMYICSHCRFIVGKKNVCTYVFTNMHGIHQTLWPAHILNGDLPDGRY